MKETTIKYIMPYPYRAYTKIEQQKSNESFKNFRSRMMRSVQYSRRDVELIITDKERMFLNYLSKSKENLEIYNWLMDHKEKMFHLTDFDGVDFGISIDQRKEKFDFDYPTPKYEEDLLLYPEYDPHWYDNATAIERLEWMNEHCEFIPIRICNESIWVDGVSHKFSHIKRDIVVMRYLEDYLESTPHPPKNNIYYFLEMNSRNGAPSSAMFYLRRDLILSPKKPKKENTNDSSI